MKNKKNVLKKILSGMIAASVIASTALAADFDWELDFESGVKWSGGEFSFNKNYNSSILNLEDGEHNNVLKMPTENKDMGTLGSFYFNNTIEERDYVISFEFLALQENARFVTQWSTTDGKVITCFTVNNNGVAGFAKNGSWAVDPPEGITQYYGGKKYEVGKWHTADMVVDIDTKTRKYYIDGEYLGEGVETNFGSGLVKNIAILHGKTYVTGAINPETQGVYFDNFSVKYTDSDSFEKEVVSDGKELRFEFTETLVSDLSESEIYDCATGEKVVGVIEQSGKTLKFTSESDFSDAQYAISIPGGEIESVTGNKIIGEYLYFYPQNMNESYIESATLTDIYGKEYKPLSEVPITQSEITLFTKGDITASSDEVLEAISLKSEDDECVLSEAEISDGKITVKIDGFLKMSTKYILSVDGVLPQYKAVFTTNDETVEGFFEVVPVFEDNTVVDVVTASEIFAKTDIINTTNTGIFAKIGMAAYENKDGILKMVGFTAQEVEIPSMKLVALAPGRVEVKFDVTENADVIKTFIWQEDYVPVVKSVIVGNYDRKMPSIESGVFENLDGTVDIASEISGELISVIVTDKNDIVVYADQTENTALTTINMAGNTSEEYKVTVTNNEGDAKEYTIAYINAEEFTSENGVASVIDNSIQLDKEEGAEKISEIIEDNYKLFGISEELFEKVDTNQVGDILYSKLKDENLSVEEMGWKETSVIVNKIFLIASVANAKLENVFDYKEELNLDEDKNWEWYNKEYVTEVVKKDMTKRLCGKYETEADFYKKLEEVYILAVVKDSDGEDNVRMVLNNFYKEIGIDKNGRDKTYRKLMGKDFDSYKDLRNEFFELENEKETSGGSNGSGGSKKTSTTSYPVNMVEKNDTEQIRYDIFNDLEGYDWANQAIVYLAEKRIVTGKTQELFAPADYVTREEFAAMLVRAIAYNAEAADISFTDTVDGAWYDEYLKKAVGAGIIKGHDDGSFGVGEYITRQDMVVMLNRAANYTGIVFDAQSMEKFADDFEIADYAKEAVYIFKKAGIVNGVSEDRFSPVANASRAQAAKVIFELLNV